MENENLRQILSDICGSITDSQRPHPVTTFKKFDFENDDHLILEDDYFLVETAIALDKIAFRDDHTVQFENYILGRVSEKLDDCDKSQVRNFLRENIHSILENDLGVKKNNYLSDLKERYSYNWDNNLTNQIQFLQFELDNCIFAFIQLSYKGIDQRCISNPYLVKLRSEEAIFNITSYCELENAETHDIITALNLEEKFNLDKENKVYIEKSTGEKYIPHFYLGV